MPQFAVKNAYRCTLALPAADCQAGVITALQLSRLNYDFEGNVFCFWAAKVEYWRWGFFDDTDQESMHIYIKGRITPQDDHVELYWESENIQESLIWVYGVAVSVATLIALWGILQFSFGIILFCSFPPIVFGIVASIVYYHYRTMGLANFHAKDNQIYRDLFHLLDMSPQMVEKITLP